MIMAREIKFRGKDILSGDWRYGYAQFNYDKTRAQIISPLRIDISAFPGQFFHVDKDTVSQFTGLLDKIGKEIYEGDIVKTPLLDPIFCDIIKDKFCNAEIRFNKGSFVVSYYRGDHNIYLSDLNDKIRVLGNKFDNPELLEE
jgi:uncharacterized phage protein (TIGR01671 family)